MKNMALKTLLPIIIFTLAVGCGNQKSNSSASEVEEGIDIQKDPLDAIQKALELGKEIGNANSDTAVEQEPVAPISFKDLLEHLPKPPQGWTAKEPMGETTSIGSYGISQVSQTYSQADKIITVTIFDWAFNSSLYTPFLLTTKFSQESTEGYNKGIKIGDIPGREEYRYQSRQGSLNLLLDSRFFVRIDGDAIEEQELREWWSKIDRHSLSKMNTVSKPEEDRERDDL